MFILILEVVINTIVIDLVACSVGGISYMDPLSRRQHQNLPMEDPCNPPYWYPRYIPEYCLEKTTITAKTIMPLPVPVPVPHPIALPPIYPISKSFPINYPQPNLQPNFPIPITGAFRVGEPFSTNPVMAAPGVPYQPLFPPYRQIGMVPGLPGIVSPDGGLNLLPFSDAYSDLLEKHKSRILRKRMQKIIRDYRRSSWRKHYG